MPSELLPAQAHPQLSSEDDRQIVLVKGCLCLSGSATAECTKLFPRSWRQEAGLRNLCTGQTAAGLNACGTSDLCRETLNMAVSEEALYVDFTLVLCHFVLFQLPFVLFAMYGSDENRKKTSSGMTPSTCVFISLLAFLSHRRL